MTLHLFPIEAAEYLSSHDSLIIDVRCDNEREVGIIANSISLAMDEVLSYVNQHSQSSDSIVIYCSKGIRSGKVAAELVQEGFTEVHSIMGGFDGWARLQLPVESQQQDLSQLQLQRYSRHIRLDKVGIEGQKKLLRARVLIIGAGGLGSPAALYLAGAGVGTLGIVDHDHVDLSNLQRQILYTTGQVGRPKCESAREQLQAFNPDICIQSHQIHIEENNIDAILRGYDIIVDGTDNLPTRYIVNDAACRLGKKLVSGAISAFDGQVTVFDGQSGTCYRCLYPEAKNASCPSCADLGVLGALPGIIGSMQAMEVIKLITGIGEPLIGRLLLYNGLTATTRLITYVQDPACPNHA